MDWFRRASEQELRARAYVAQEQAEKETLRLLSDIDCFDPSLLTHRNAALMLVEWARWLPRIDDETKGGGPFLLEATFNEESNLPSYRLSFKGKQVLDYRGCDGPNAYFHEFRRFRPGRWCEELYFHIWHRRKEQIEARRRALESQMHPRLEEPTDRYMRID
jgi:hypothetical protein